jgi:hypothetical protein
LNADSKVLLWEKGRVGFLRRWVWQNGPTTPRREERADLEDQLGSISSQACLDSKHARGIGKGFKDIPKNL